MGPRGSERVTSWASLALQVERDERVARKLTWLRPTDPAADSESLSEFMKRTFLARPWIHEADFTMAALDSLNRLATLADSSMPRNTVSEWIQLALSKTNDSDALVEGLVAAWVRRGHE